MLKIMMRKLWAAASITCVVAVLSVHPAAAEGPGFAVEPASNGSAPRSYFQLSASGGETVTDSLIVRNVSAEPLRVRLAAVDATTGPTGGVSYGLADGPSERMAKWVSLSASELSLGANGSQAVEVRVAVPPDAATGHHLGGIVAWSPSKAESASPISSAGLAADVRLTTRRVVAVQVTVPGPIEPALSITGVRAEPRPGGAYLLVDVSNVGNSLTTADGMLDVTGMSVGQPFHVDTFVPETSIAYPLRWADRMPNGKHSATVELRYDNNVVTWHGDVAFGDSSTADRSGSRTSGLTSILPGSPGLGWVWLGMPVVVLALAGCTARGFRRSKADSAHPPEQWCRTRF